MLIDVLCLDGHCRTKYVYHFFTGQNYANKGKSSGRSINSSVKNSHLPTLSIKNCWTKYVAIPLFYVLETRANLVVYVRKVPSRSQKIVYNILGTHQKFLARARTLSTTFWEHIKCSQPEPELCIQHFGNTPKVHRRRQNL